MTQTPQARRQPAPQIGARMRSDRRRRRPTLVPAERYYSAEFARLEVERMWPRVWQLACTVDHVAEPGDYFEYRCGPYSVLIVRDDDGELRAFQNVCRHRGNSLCAGSGSDLRELRCGYHGWTWDLARRAQARAQPQGLRRAADGRASAASRSTSTRGSGSSSSTSTPHAMPLARLPGAGPRTTSRGTGSTTSGATPR